MQLLPAKMPIPVPSLSPPSALPIPRKCLPAALIQIHKAGEPDLHSQLRPGSDLTFSLFGNPRRARICSIYSIWNHLRFLRILGRKSWAWPAYLSHDLPRGWSVGCVQDLPNKQRLESFPYDAGERTGLQALHHIIAVRTCGNERQMFIGVLTDLWELAGLWSQRDSSGFNPCSNT